MEHYRISPQPVTIRMSAAKRLFLFLWAALIGLGLPGIMIYLTTTSSASDRAPAVFFSIVGVGAAAALLWIAVSFKIQLSDAMITFSNGFKRTTVGYHELNSVRYIFSRTRGMYFYWLLLVYGRHGSDKLLYIPLYVSRAAFETIVDRLHQMAPDACPARPLTLEDARAAY